ncbi:hypothetical protein [Streptomyces sp.]|uniref:hypothetical protein n=1 Tax=Streptomyces sp. TaxID=1931 RepID=UPI002F95F8FF
MTLLVYWLGRPRRWFGSLSSVTTPESFADATLPERALKASLAVSSFAVGLVGTPAVAVMVFFGWSFF